jgi:purine-cytosine permease-like protein
MGGPFMWGVFTSVVLYSNAIPDADTSYVLALVNAAPLWFIPALIYVGLASGMVQAVINTYGTGLDTSAVIPELNRVQATLLACVVAPWRCGSFPSRPSCSPRANPTRRRSGSDDGHCHVF